MKGASDMTWKLYHANTNEEVILPLRVSSYEEAWDITSFTPPRHVASEGRVHCALVERHNRFTQEFYPSVFNLVIRREV